MTTVNTVKVQGGADYAMVVNRVHRFVEDHETGQIHTEIVKDENGHVIFKAYALIDGVIRGTGHAHELEGSNNINNTSHYEACETSAVGRSLAFLGYSPDGSLASYEEIANAELQQSNIKEHEITLKVAVDYISAALHVAIFEDNEEGILEVLKSMFGNQTLRQKVNETLDNQQKAYLTERQAKLTKAAKIKAAEKHERNVVAAKNLAEKEVVDLEAPIKF